MNGITSVNGSASRRPKQAVILAGGRGTRLKPLTDTRPKAMVEFHGKPFLAYIMEMLRDQGFERVLLLLGYLPEVIQDYFGDGYRFGVEISYSVSWPDYQTVRRLQLAQDRLEPSFLLLYCDNYWPAQMERMWAHFASANVPAMVTVYRNQEKYSRDNVIVDDSHFVRVFDPSRSTPGLSGVEIGYAIVTRPVLDLLPDEDAPFEKAVYPKLVRSGGLLAYVTDHRYYSVGSHERLPRTQDFLSRRRTVMLDRDGVLNWRPARGEYIRSWQEFKWLPGSKHALSLLNAAGYRVIVVSNQAGVARGAMTESDLQLIHQKMREDAGQTGGHIDAVYTCTHRWNDGCSCRKPSPGMLFQAQRDFALDLTRTLFIGDDDCDREAALAAGSPFVLVGKGVGLLDVTQNLLSHDSTNQVCTNHNEFS
jgi:D-glycero-D-manno-heptose 1,7-bisphosphate phosphatase